MEHNTPPSLMPPSGAPDAPADENVRAALEGISVETIRETWFTMAHLVLEPGSRILDVDCDDGTDTYAMAAMNPDMHFTGIDEDKRLITRAQKQYKLPNLEFVHGDIMNGPFPENSFDAIINAFNLHEIYSLANCNPAAVDEVLEHQFTFLKDHGIMLLRCYAMPPPDEYLLLEMPDEPGRGDEIEELSETDLLILYSEQARPRHDESYRGFYLEDMPPRFPKTRLFRLPGKWAHEFALRKDDRENWAEELHKEYTFYTERDIRQKLRAWGSRVLYTAPHWDEQVIKKRFEKKYRLFDENGTPLGPPPTNYIAVSQKIADRKSQVVQERKPARSENRTIRITAMRDETDGRIMDVVSRGLHITEILPYRVTDKGRLHIFVHEGVPRGLINAVPRSGPNIDGKRWSGHMTEAIALPEEIVQDVRPDHPRDVIRFGRTYLGLKPLSGEMLEDGPGFYPAPDHIDERIQTKYLQVEAPSGPVEPNTVIEDIDGFSTRGRIREIDAQRILNAIGVGFIPSSRLEVQILTLYAKLGIPYESWAECPLALEDENIKESYSAEDILARCQEKDNRFKESKGTGGQLRTLHSIFVDEGQVDGGITGLASRDMDFVVSEEGTMNTAVVLPLTRKINGEVMAGIVEQYLPVPQRYKGNGYLISCPSFPLPKEITNYELARKYIADKFEVKIENVAKMGESYFSHIGVTPNRIFPFAVSTAGVKGWQKQGRTHGVTKYTPLPDVWKLIYLDNHDSFLKVVAMSYCFALGMDSQLSPSFSFSHSMEAEKSGKIAGISTTELAIPSSSSLSPSSSSGPSDSSSTSSRPVISAAPSGDLSTSSRSASSALSEALESFAAPPESPSEQENSAPDPQEPSVQSTSRKPSEPQPE